MAQRDPLEADHEGKDQGQPHRRPAPGINVPVDAWIGLAATRDWPTIDEAALTAWMHEHLRVIALPYDDAETLGRLEDKVLLELNPPLNLMGMDASESRTKLSELRRYYGQ